jgi:hypothetical protein
MLTLLLSYLAFSGQPFSKVDRLNGVGPQGFLFAVQLFVVGALEDFELLVVVEHNGRNSI